jgi:hypothetical protein
MRTLVAWLRFHGWHNAYWREDWAMETCPHPAIYQTEPWLLDDGLGWLRVCRDCGKTIETIHEIQGLAALTSTDKETQG